MKKVCAIVPVYKTDEKLLRKCIESLIEQTIDSMEIILIDDGSPDQCGAICDEYSRVDVVKVIHKQNEGVSVARNVGIDSCNSEYISFVDADDWVEREAFEKAYHQAKLNNDEIIQWTYVRHVGDKVYSGYHSFDFEGILSDEQLEELKLKAIIDKFFSFSGNDGVACGAPWAKLYKTEFLRKNNLRFVPGLHRSQDRIFNLYAYTKAKKVEYFDWPYNHYVVNDESAVVSYRPNVEYVYNKYLKCIESYKNNYNRHDDAFQTAQDICKCYALQQIFTKYYFHYKCKIGFLKKYFNVKQIASNENYCSGILNIEKLKGYVTQKQYIIFLLLNKKRYFLAAFLMQIDCYRKLIKNRVKS